MAIINPPYQLTGNQTSAIDGQETSELIISLLFQGMLTPMLRISPGNVEVNQAGTWKSLVPSDVIPVPQVPIVTD